jgi:hypothetical protein
VAAVAESCPLWPSCHLPPMGGGRKAGGGEEQLSPAGQTGSPATPEKGEPRGWQVAWAVLSEAVVHPC